METASNIIAELRHSMNNATVDTLKALTREIGQREDKLKRLYMSLRTCIGLLEVLKEEYVNTIDEWALEEIETCIAESNRLLEEMTP